MILTPRGLAEASMAGLWSRPDSVQLIRQPDVDAPLVGILSFIGSTCPEFTVDANSNVGRAAGNVPEGCGNALSPITSDCLVALYGRRRAGPSR
jgi:hypothetical protein